MEAHGDLSIALSDKYYYHPHLKDEETEAQKGEAIGPRPDFKDDAPNIREGRGCRRRLRKLAITIWVSLSLERAPEPTGVHTQVCSGASTRNVSWGWETEGTGLAQGAATPQLGQCGPAERWARVARLGF